MKDKLTSIRETIKFIEWLIKQKNSLINLPKENMYIYICCIQITDSHIKLEETISHFADMIVPADGLAPLGPYID